MYLPARAHRCTPTLFDNAYVVCHICVFTMRTSRLFVEQPRIYPLSSAVYTPTSSPDTTLGSPFFFSRPHLFSILKHLISRGELLWGQIPRDRSVLPSWEFRGKFSPREHNRFDKSRRCSSWLPFAFSRTLLIAMTSYNEAESFKVHLFILKQAVHAKSYKTIKFEWVTFYILQ